MAARRKDGLAALNLIHLALMSRIMRNTAVLAKETIKQHFSFEDVLFDGDTVQHNYFRLTPGPFLQ